MIFLWEKSGIEVEAAQKILYIFAVNATLSKDEGASTRTEQFQFQKLEN